MKALSQTSWKTTVIGAILAIIIAVQPLIATGKIDWKAVGIAALIALLGYVAKDSNVTGGTVSNGQTLIDNPNKPEPDEYSQLK